MHLVVDGHGHPLAATLTAGQAHESRQVEPLLRMIRLRHRRRRPRQLAGDKGYSYPGVRAHLRRRGIRAVIPRRVDQLGKRGRPAHFDRDAYRRRNAVERCVGWLKGNRGVGTRHDKLATSFLAFVRLAMIQRLLRALRQLRDTT